MDFQKIATVKDEQLKNFTAICTKVSELKAGTGAKGDWTMKIFTFEDTTGTLDLTCFNGQIKKFEKGFTYEVENFYWRKHDDKQYANLGDYAKVTKTNAPLKEPEPTKPTADTPPNQVKLPKPSPALVDFVQQENMALLQIESIITLQHTELGIPIIGQQIGMHTREIFEKLLGTNLIKASKLS